MDDYLVKSKSVCSSRYIRTRYTEHRNLPGILRDEEPVKKYRSVWNSEIIVSEQCRSTDILGNDKVLNGKNITKSTR